MRLASLFRFLRTLIAIGLCTAVSGCALPKERPPAQSPGSVVFELEPVDATNPLRLGWVARHEADGKIARFRIELQPEAKNGKLPAFVKCSLIREAGSDGTAFLRELSKALAGSVPPQASGVHGLDVAAVILGRNLSRGGGGDQIAGLFGSEPKGSWISTKLFLGEAEVFLNLDPIGGYGEFSLKDPVYGPDVLRALGRVFQGEATDGVVDLDQASVKQTAELTDTPPLPTPTASPTPNRDDAKVTALIEKAQAGRQQSERAQALKDLGGMGGAAHAAIPVFLAALKSDDPVIRALALSHFSSLDPDPETGLAAVRPLLNDKKPTNQVIAAGLLADFGQPQEAVNCLAILLHGEARVQAAYVLVDLGAYSKPALPGLIQMLETRRGPLDGYAAAKAIASMGPQAESALPALRRASADPDKSVSGEAKYAIRQLGGG
jgi:hypothetical protein